MPALVLFGRRWLIASDDVPLPAAGLALFHFVRRLCGCAPGNRPAGPPPCAACLQPEVPAACLGGRLSMRPVRRPGLQPGVAAPTAMLALRHARPLPPLPPPGLVHPANHLVCVCARPSGVRGGVAVRRRSGRPAVRVCALLRPGGRPGEPGGGARGWGGVGCVCVRVCVGGGGGGGSSVWGGELQSCVLRWAGAVPHGARHAGYRPRVSQLGRFPAPCALSLTAAPAPPRPARRRCGTACGAGHSSCASGAWCRAWCIWILHPTSAR